MKKHRLLLVLISLCTSMIFAEGNYAGGNGTVISRITDGKQTIEIRKLEISNFQAGDKLAENNNTIYNHYTTQTPVGELEWWKERFNIHKVCSIELQETNQWGTPLGEMWLEISTKKFKGWICCNDRYPSRLYKNNKYSITETITTASQTWTVRKLEQLFTIWSTVDIMDTPGLQGKKIHTFQFTGVQSNFSSVAITEEKETINGKTDYWVKIEYEEGKYGWVFGVFLDVERGGPKYRIPEDELSFNLGNQP